MWDATALSKRRTWIPVVAACLFVKGLTYATDRIWYPFVIQLAEGIGVSEEDISYLVAVGHFVAFTGPVIGVLVEKIGYARGTVISALVVAIGDVIVAASSSLGVVFLGVIIMTFGRVGVLASVQGYLATVGPQEMKGFLIASTEASWALSGLIGFPITGAVIESTSWRIPFVILAALAVPASIGFILVARWIAKKLGHTKGQPEPAGSEGLGSGEGTMTPEHVTATNPTASLEEKAVELTAPTQSEALGGTPSAVSSQEQIVAASEGTPSNAAKPSTKLSSASIVKLCIVDPGIWGAFIFGVFLFLGFDALFFTVGKFMNRDYGLETIEVGVAAIVLGAAEIVGSVSVAAFGDRLGLRRVLNILLLSSVVLFGFLMSLHFWSAPLWVALLALFLVWFLMESTIVSSLSLVSSVFPEAP